MQCCVEEKDWLGESRFVVTQSIDPAGINCGMHGGEQDCVRMYITLRRDESRTCMRENTAYCPQTHLDIPISQANSAHFVYNILQF